MKKSKLINLLYALTVIVVIGMAALPSYAYDYNYQFEFSFEYGNRERTENEAKHSNEAITMSCTGGSGETDFGYLAKGYTSMGIASTGEVKFDIGTTKPLYGLERYTNTTVYIQAALNQGEGVASFEGTWNPH